MRERERDLVLMIGSVVEMVVTIVADGRGPRGKGLLGKWHREVVSDAAMKGGLGHCSGP